MCHLGSRAFTFASSHSMPFLTWASSTHDLWSIQRKMTKDPMPPAEADVPPPPMAQPAPAEMVPPAAPEMKAAHEKKPDGAKPD